MKPKKPLRHDLKSLCGELHADDGIDPKEYFRPAGRRRADDRKTRQLCSQISDTLNMLLAECGDDVLRNLQVVRVMPAPDVSQLMVVVCPAIDGQPSAPNEVMLRLVAASGRLRAEVATAITRRRAPKLLFQYVAGEPGSEVTS